MRTSLLILGTALSLLVLSGCPIFVDTTPPKKEKTKQPFPTIKDSVYYYDPNYFSDLDPTRPYQVPSNLKISGYEDQWVIAPEFSSSSALDQVIWRVTYYGWYCVTDSLCECVRTNVMFPGDIFHLANSDSFLVGQDRVYPGDSPWGVSKRILQNDSLQYEWRQKKSLQLLISEMKDSLIVLDSCILLKEQEVIKEKWQRYAISGGIVLLICFCFRKQISRLIT